MSAGTEAETAYLQEYLQAEELIFQKYRYYAGTTQEPLLQTFFQKAAARHQNHRERLAGYLQKEDS